MFSKPRNRSLHCIVVAPRFLSRSVEKYTIHHWNAVPAGMLCIPGGEFSMGANASPDMNEVGMKATEDARPIHRVYVDGFFMDKTDVTNQQFAEFVEATGYVTIAERKLRAEDFPGAPPVEARPRISCILTS